MQYVIEPAEKSQVKLTITLDKTDWESAIKKAYEKNKSKFNIQGFRKGHVPFNVIVGQYGKEFFYEDAINLSIQEYYPQILKSETEKIYAVGDPDFSLDSVSADGCAIIAMIPVMPEVKLGAYTGIKLQKVEYNVTDADVENRISTILNNYAKEENVTDRAAKLGDITVIDYSGSVDGKLFDGGTASGQRLELGSNTFIPGFEDGVVGMTIGEEKDIPVTFPADYHAEELKGKAAIFKVKLNEIIVKSIPALTDEFVKEHLHEDTAEAYKAKIRETMEKDNASRANNENEDNLLNKIAETTEVEIPDAMIEDEITSMVQNFSYRLMYQGLKIEDYYKYAGITEQGLRDSYKEQAAQRVKKQLIVNNIIEKEKIVATDEEVDAKVKEQAESVNKSFEEYKKGMDARQFDYIKNSIVVDKLFKFLTENNDFTAANAQTQGEKPAPKPKKTKKKAE